MRKLLLATVATMGAAFGLAAAAQAQTASPGSVTVRLNGRVNWYAAVEGSTLDSIGTTKTSTAGFLGYMRLYPGFDGVAANGLHYGAAAEIRENGGTTASSETLYVFQAYGYLGLPGIGQVSFGQQNGPTVLFETGTFEGFNDGAWWGDIPALIPGAAEIAYPFVDGGYNQTSDKIVYLSPTFSGFQFAVGFTPNSVTDNSGPAVTSTTNPALQLGGGLPKNLIDIGGQYTQKFGDIGVQIGADYQYAGQVAYTGSVEEANGLSFKNMSVFSGGATATIAGFTFGGNVVYGAYNGGAGAGVFQLEPDGGSAAIGELFGLQYTAGPMTVGGSVFRFNTTGALPGGIDSGSGATITSQGLTTGQQVNNGLAIGGTYTLVPGVNLFVDYLYGWRQQGGYDFGTGNAGTDDNRVQSQLFGVGTQIQW
jgi:outer membrane protein OmpU